MKRTLLALNTRLSAIMAELEMLADDVNNAPTERKFAVAREITIKQVVLQSIEDEISILDGVVSGLDEQWGEDNVFDKPVTIYLKEI